MPGPVTEQFGKLVGKAQLEIDTLAAMTGATSMVDGFSDKDLLIMRQHVSTFPPSRELTYVSLKIAAEITRRGIVEE